MTKLSQQGIAHIALILLVVIVGMVTFAAWRVWEVDDNSNSTITIAESGDFKREEGAIFPNVRLHNMEVVELPDGRFRSYFHEGAESTKSAVSTDGGKTFVLEDGPRVQGSVPATVQLDDGKWRTYYGSQDGLLSAISTDGLTYEEELGVRITRGASGDFDEFGITHPSIVKLPDGSYRIYYDGQFKPEQGPHWRIMSAFSKDGLTWIKDEGSRIPVNESFGEFHANLSFSSHVQYKDDMYIMYFSSQGNPISASGIWRATSTNGIDFQVEDKPVLARDPEFGDKEDPQSVGGPKGVPQDPFVIKIKHGERLYYWTSDKGYRSAIH